MNRTNKMTGPPREKTRDEIDMKLLRELATLPANKFCFDCNQRGPTYVNVTIGAFVCSSCGGLLRGLNPPHRVKSLTVCSFTEVEMDRIKSRGNEYCTHIWLGKFDPKTDNVDLSSPDKRKEFMILKYEEKKFYVDPREAVKKMKPRAPAVPTNDTLVSASVPRSQTVMPNKQSIQIQRPGALSQAFSAGDISSSAVPIKFENDPFQNIKQNDNSGDTASFADFSSAFGNPVSKDSSSIQMPVTTTSSSSSNHKKPAPPPPDRYAALADLDNQLHVQSASELTTSIPSEVTSINSTPFWSTVTPAMPGAAVFAPGVQNPFQTPQAWAQPVPCAQNPFQMTAQPVPKVGLQAQNMMPNTIDPSLPNGNIQTVYWPSVSTQPWGSNKIQSNNQTDPFMSKNGMAATDKYNPWAQSFGANSANPFTNGSFTAGQSSNTSAGNPKNPFL